MRRFKIAAASVGVLACLGACSDGAGGESAVAAAAAPTESATPTALDPYAWTVVPYKEYLDAAQQIGLRPDVLVPESGFAAGLDTLCHTSPEDFAAMRKTQMANTRGTDTYTAAEYLGDEVGLRIGLACPQRMSDWTATDDERGDDGDASDDDVSEVTEEELARAQAEEAGATSDPDEVHGDETLGSEAAPSPGPTDSADSPDG
jgi:hypothetical protein